MLSLLSSESIIQIEKISPDDVHLPDVMNGVMCNDDSAACDEMAFVLFCHNSDNDYDNLVWSLLQYDTTCAINISFISHHIFYNILQYHRVQVC